MLAWGKCYTILSIIWISFVLWDGWIMDGWMERWNVSGLLCRGFRMEGKGMEVNI